MEREPHLTAIITLCTDGNTVADLEEFLGHAGHFDLGDDHELLDGPPAGPAPAPGLPDTPEAHTLGELRAWAAALRGAGTSADTTIVGIADISVDLPVTAVEVGVCGDHIGETPAMVFIQTHPSCAQHRPTTTAHTAPVTE